ncbi:MAG: ATP-binding protein [Methanothrix sp.]|jgi:nucleolar protein 56|nr:ATP-binding protein [Methanothrix sp.]
MEILTWFGRVDLQTGYLLTGSMLDREESDGILKLQQEPAGTYPLSQPDLRALAKACGFAADDAEYNRLLREAALGLVRRSILTGSTVEQDLLQAMEALDNFSQAINLLDERLYEWSRLHSQKIVHGKDLAEGLKEDENMGLLAKAILGLRESRKATEMDVSATVQSLAPNLSSLAGPVLAARLISRAGGLSRLAKMPSSRVQVMGAEKSLFKHLKGNAPSPKHGIIFRHPAVIGSAKKLRGRVARTLAAKLAIAARLDHFGAGLSLDLQASLDARLRDIKQRGRNKGK